MCIAIDSPSVSPNRPTKSAHVGHSHSPRSQVRLDFLFLFKHSARKGCLKTHRRHFPPSGFRTLPKPQPRSSLPEPQLFPLNHSLPIHQPSSRTPHHYDSIPTPSLKIQTHTLHPHCVCSHKFPLSNWLQDHTRQILHPLNTKPILRPIHKSKAKPQHELKLPNKQTLRRQNSRTHNSVSHYRYTCSVY